MFNRLTLAIVCLVSLATFPATNLNANAQTRINPGSEVNWPSGCTAGLIYSPQSNSCVSATGPALFFPPAIAGAISSAGNNGSVVIPGNYAGTDTFFANPHNVRIQDQRPFNPNNTPRYSGGVMPSTTIKAAEYGALCNGLNDDTAAIQAAVSAADVVSGGVGLAGGPAMGGGTVELPQGRCIISSPIVLMNYGSLQGSANGTWMSPMEPWRGGADTDMVEIEESYEQSSFNKQSVSLINRFVKGINFWYNYHGHAFTAIKVWNPTGHDSAHPYPNGAASNPQAYQIPGVTIEGNTFYTLDTAVDFEDCGECLFTGNQIFFVRVGVVDGANNYGLVLSNDWIQVGTHAYTSIAGGFTNGVISQSQGRWSCTGGSGAACSGGSIAQNVIASPQGLTLSNVDFEAFDIDANIINCLAFIASNSGFDTGGASSVNPAIYLGQLKFAQIYDNFMASNRVDSPVIEIAGLTGPQGSGINNQDGVWLQGNFIYAYRPSTSNGIQFDSGAFARRNVIVTDNQFDNLANGISISTPMTYSTFRGNYGNSITGQLIYLNAKGAGSFVGTLIEGNTSSSSFPVYTDAAGGGFVTGFNQSVVQVTGTFVATGTGCTITAGAVGNSCGPITVTNPVNFKNTAYKISGCSIVGASGANVISVVDPPRLGQQFTVYEAALSATAAGGGTVNCQVSEQ
jgi:hypothetical protein